MSIPGAGNPLLLGGAGGYKIERSLRFNSADSAYLSRTPASAGNRKTWTWSGWVKRSSLPTTATYQSLFASGDTAIGLYDADNTLYFYDSVYGGFLRITSSKYRDPSAWYHIVCALDTTQATAANRVRFYINGVEISSYATSNDPTQNADLGLNQALSHQLGAQTLYGRYLSGYLADIHFIDGQALTPSSFGETDINGVWQPKAYTGTYGTNGFQLKFADNSNNTATTLGKDTSGNGNNWTPNNLSVTAGAGNDSLVDSPTNYGVDTGAGGAVRGNYATWNPLDNNSQTLANGNLDVTGSLDAGSVNGTIAVSSGKYYWEITASASGGDIVGIWSTSSRATNYPGATADSYGYNQFNGQKYNNGSASAYGATFSSGDVIGVALDMDAGTLVFYKNGVSQGTAFSSLTGSFRPSVRAGYTGNPSAGTFANFGQRPFAYTAPSGFKALCTQNLPTPTITKPSTVMDVALWTGNGSARSITGLGFNPDLVWIKGRSGATDHALYDSVRGATLDLVSNSAAAETTQTQGLTAFNSDGFSLGTLAKVNTNAATYAGWVFDAGSSTVTNTAGTISSQVRANASAGFSVVTWTGNGASATVGHGLGVAPSFLIVKSRSTSNSWGIYHRALGGAFYLLFDTSAAGGSANATWGSANSDPTASVFSVGSGAATNSNGSNFVAYCFAPVASYSAFGSYIGNGSADGPMVFTNMRPRWIMLKRTDSTSNWTIIDTAREGYNVDNDPLYPNLSDAEGTTDLADILSNGFKLRSTDASVNANTGTYIYAAFAEAPFALARAR